MMHNGKGRNYSEGQGNNGSTELLCRIKSSLPGIPGGSGNCKEKEAAEKLSAALKDCVQSIDTVIPFFKSEAGVKYFGKETAAALAKAADEAKEKGSKLSLIHI